MGTQAGPAVDKVAKFDDVQARFAPLAVLPALALADIFCIFDHYAPWSVVAWGTGMGMILASIWLHGMWRLKQIGRPVVAISLVLLAALIFGAEPFLLLPRTLAFALFMLPTAFGLYLWIKILGGVPSAPPRALLVSEGTSHDAPS
jgi:hypothetical protein